MSKKNKRKVRKTTTRKREVAVRSTGVARASEFSPDYTAVIKDLKRIGTLAGTFFVILVILSFILR